MSSLPKIMLVGGADIDARIELMLRLKNHYKLSAVGSNLSIRDKFIKEGFDYEIYNLSRKASPFYDLLTIAQLLVIFRRLKPEIVHTFDTKPGVWGRLAARIVGIPIVIGTLPGLGTLYTRNNFKIRIIRCIYQIFQKLACKFSDLTIFQNKIDAMQFISEGIIPKQKAKIISGSGVCTELFDPAKISENKKKKLRSELGISQNNILVTMVSRIIRSKGVIEFMKAAEKVYANNSNIRFLIVGAHDGDSFDKLNKKELLQLKENVIWPGKRQDIPAVLSISDIFVLPSAYREGIPRVLMEAASMGLPIITTDSPGCNEVVKHGLNGLLISAHCPEEIIYGILRLIKEPELRYRYGLASRRHALEHFDISIIAKKIDSVYLKLLERTKLSQY